MKLTVLGNNGPYPGPGGACSGYLVEHDGTRIMADCGNGVLANLQKVAGIGDLDAVIITHLHSDHMSDLMVLRYAVMQGKQRGLAVNKLDVWAPPEPDSVFSVLKNENAFNTAQITAGLELLTGGIKVCFRRTKHPYMCYALSFSAGQKKLVYSGDTAWDPELVEFFAGSDTLLLDAGLLSRDKVENAPHMTAAECGKAASRANAGRLLLTHIRPGYDALDIEEEAGEFFPGAEVVSILHTYTI